MQVGQSGRRKICLRDKEAELVLEMYQVLVFDAMDTVEISSYLLI